MQKFSDFAEELNPVWQGHNRAIVKSIDSDGLIVCDVQTVEEQSGEEVIVRSDSNIGFTTENAPFELSQADIDEINGIEPI